MDAYIVSCPFPIVPMAAAEYAQTEYRDCDYQKLYMICHLLGIIAKVRLGFTVIHDSTVHYEIHTLEVCVLHQIDKHNLSICKKLFERFNAFPFEKISFYMHKYKKSFTPHQCQILKYLLLLLLLSIDNVLYTTTTTVYFKLTLSLSLSLPFICIPTDIRPVTVGLTYSTLYVNERKTQRHKNHCSNHHNKLHIFATDF